MPEPVLVPRCGIAGRRNGTLLKSASLRRYVLRKAGGLHRGLHRSEDSLHDEAPAMKGPSGRISQGAILRSPAARSRPSEAPIQFLTEGSLMASSLAWRYCS